MSRLRVLRWVMVLWVVWHALFGLLATFAPEMGASSVGWTAEGGWDAALITMSTQYGMVMLLLAGVYGLAALEPLRYLGVIWIAIAEQILGIAYASVIIVTFGQLTMTQFIVQAAINIVVVLVFLALWSGLRGEQRAAWA